MSVGHSSFGPNPSANLVGIREGRSNSPGYCLGLFLCPDPLACLLAAGAALKGWVGLVWACAGLLGILSILGAMSIGVLVAPLALVLFVSALLLSLSRSEGS